MDLYPELMYLKFKIIVLQIGKDVAFYNSNDWIEIGDISGMTCIANTLKCDVNTEVTVLVWIKVSSCPQSTYGTAIISSYGENYSPGFRIFCNNQKIG